MEYKSVVLLETTTAAVWAVQMVAEMAAQMAAQMVDSRDTWTAGHLVRKWVAH